MPYGSTDWKEMLAQSMMPRNLGAPIASPWQGLAQMLQAGLSGYGMKMAQDERTENRKASFDALAAAMTGDGRLTMDELRNFPDQDLAMALMPEAFRQDEPAAPPPSRTRTQGSQEIFEEWNPDTETWSQVSAAPRWAPQQAPDPVRGVEIDGRLVNPVTGEIIADFSQQTGGAGGPLEGTGLDPQLYNAYVTGEQILAQGGTLTPEHQLLYDLAQRRMMAPETRFDRNTGQLVTQEPAPLPALPRQQQGGPTTPDGMGISAPAEPYDPSPPTPTVERIGERSFSPDQAVRVQSLREGVASVERIEDLIYQNGDVGGEVNRGVVGAGDVPIIGAVPFTQGRQLRAEIMNAVASIIMARSGQAASEAEVARTAEAFIPSPLDPPDAIDAKMRNLRSFLQGALDLIDPTGEGVAAPVQRGGATSGGTPSAEDPLGILD